MGVVSFFIITLVIILLFSTIILAVLQYYIKVPPAWPYIFYLTNLGTEPINTQVLVNGDQYELYSLPSGLRGQVIIGSNLKNPKTGRPFNRQEVITVAFYFDNKTPNVEYSSRNVKQVPTFSGTKCTGTSCAKETPAALREVTGPVYNKFIMNKQGYYTIFF